MKHKHSKIHWMTFSGKVRCVDCWSNDELSLCKSCGKMANHSSKDCPIVPTPSVECNCACHCHSGPCKSAHSHFCIHCQPNKKEGATLCDYEKTGRCLDTTHSGHWSQPKLGCKEDCQHIKDCPNATQKGVVPPQTDKTTWESKFNKYYGLMFECGDYEQLIKDIANELRKEYARGQLDEITAIRQLDNKTRDNDSHTYDIYTQSDMDFAQAQALDIYRGKLWELIKDRHETCDDCSLRAELENLLTLEK